MYFFIADLHCNHNRHFIYEARGFSSIHEHDNTIINNWNAKVTDKDHVFIVGDFCWGPPAYTLWLLHTLKGKKYMIKGNHDKSFKGECLKQVELFAPYHGLTIQDKSVRGGKQFIVLCHYPILSWDRSHYGSLMLHGHTHGKTNNKGLNRLEVGVDVIGPAPISYDEVKIRIEANYVGC